MYTLMGGGLLCAVSGLVLLIVATATDFWMQYRYSGNLSNQGLWRFCVAGKCHAHTITVAFWDATRAFMLLSILSCFAGIILGLTAFSSGAKSARTRSAGVTLLVAGFFALLALSVYTGVTVNFFGKRYVDWRFSWSYILGWIGIILTVSAGIFHICAFARNSSRDVGNVSSG
ncbi:lens fiber membrane intrinsic protein-like [Phyllobates terribilis]|uniref:lens fiber membrane intrinsic protein-like n=1 Tax=Phyllobates terribilis TaxID=111132 RepID=UPI003CCAC4F4